MRVALVVAPSPAAHMKEEFADYLGLGYLAAVLRREGHHADLVNSQFQGLDHRGVIKLLQDLSPELIGITAPFAVDLLSAMKLAHCLRVEGFEGLIVLGGHPPTFTYQSVLEQCPAVDVIVRGEGEITFLELVNCVKQGRSWQGLPGLAWRDGTRVASSAPRPLICNLDQIPFPARDEITTRGTPVSVTRFRRLGLASAMVILSSRGCPFSCSFCSVHAFYSSAPGPLWRPRSAENVFEELRESVERWGCRSFRFTDDNFFGSCRAGKERAERLANLILDRGLEINFVIECCVRDVEPGLLGLLKRAGLTQVNLGIESGSARVLHRFNKPTTPEMNRKSVEILFELGIQCNPNFILFDPDTTLEDLRENLEFFRNTKLYRIPGAYHTLLSNRLALFAGTTSLQTYQAQSRTKVWRFPELTDEENGQLASLGAVYDAAFKDSQVFLFSRLHYPIVTELERRERLLNDASIRLQALLVSTSSPISSSVSQFVNNVRSRLDAWQKNAGSLALRLFAQALEWVEQGAISEQSLLHYREQLLSELDRYDRIHLGKRAQEFASELQEVKGEICDHG